LPKYHIFFIVGEVLSFENHSMFFFIKQLSFISQDQGNSCLTYDPFNDAAHLFINQSDSSTCLQH